MFSVRGECVMIIRLKRPIDYQFLLLFIANSVPFVYTNNCHVWLPCMSLLLAMYVSVDCQVYAFWMSYNIICLLYAWTTATHEPLLCLLTARYAPLDCHLCTCSIAICGPVVGRDNCHTWASSVPVHCHACASWLPFLYLLIATRGPVVCHIGASCLPHVGHMCATQRPHVGLTWASVAKRVWPTCVP